MASASSISRARGRRLSRENLRIEDCMRDSVSERCVIGVGIREVRSTGSSGVSSGAAGAEAVAGAGWEEGDVVVRVRRVVALLMDV